MPSIDMMLTLAMVTLMLSLTPGPSSLYIMARGVAQGKQGGIAAAGGMAIGSFIYVLATVLGLAAIFQYSPLAYTVLKLFGAGYLLFLGYQYLRAQPLNIDDGQLVPSISTYKILRQSVLVELTNPKTALFFLAFLPQFVDVDSGSVASQLVILGLVYGLVALLCDICIALLSGQLGTWLAGHQKVLVIQDRIAGTLLVSLGAYLGIDTLVNKS